MMDVLMSIVCDNICHCGPVLWVAAVHN